MSIPIFHTGWKLNAYQDEKGRKFEISFQSEPQINSHLCGKYAASSFSSVAFTCSVSWPSCLLHLFCLALSDIWPQVAHDDTAVKTLNSDFWNPQSCKNSQPVYAFQSHRWWQHKAITTLFTTDESDSAATLWSAKSAMESILNIDGILIKEHLTLRQTIITSCTST